MILLDTNVFVGIIAEDDGLHEKARKVLATVVEPILLHEYIYIEVLSVLAVRYSMKEVEQFLFLVTEQISKGSFKFTLSNPEHLRRMTMLFRKQKNNALSFTDVALLYFSQYCEVITFDKALGKAIGASKKK